MGGPFLYRVQNNLMGGCGYLIVTGVCVICVSEFWEVNRDVLAFWQRAISILVTSLFAYFHP